MCSIIIFRKWISLVEYGKDEGVLGKHSSLEIPLTGRSDCLVVLGARAVLEIQIGFKICIQYNTVQIVLSAPHRGFSETMIKTIKKILKDY